MKKHISFEDGYLNYVVKGEGPAVVLLHGFLEDHSIWNKFADKLSEKYKVVAIDLPGFGNSSVFKEGNSLAFMANAVYYILLEENINDCIMVGHSMGGYVTLSFAKHYPDKLNGIVLFHSQAAADDEEGKHNRDRTINVINKDHLGFIHSFVPSLFAEENVEKYETEIEQLMSISSQTDKEGIVAALEAMRDRPGYLGVLSEIDIPVFFIIGKRDSRISVHSMMEQLTLPHNCEALILDGVGHMGFIEAENITYLAIEHFVERNY